MIAYKAAFGSPLKPSQKGVPSKKLDESASWFLKGATGLYPTSDTRVQSANSSPLGGCVRGWGFGGGGVVVGGWEYRFRINPRSSSAPITARAVRVCGTGLGFRWLGCGNRITFIDRNFGGWGVGVGSRPLSFMQIDADFGGKSARSLSCAEILYITSQNTVWRNSGLKIHQAKQVNNPPKFRSP